VCVCVCVCVCACRAHAQAGKTPLLWAADCGHAGVVTLLLNAGASVDQPDSVSWVGADGAPLCVCVETHMHGIAWTRRH
jgi:hypothetical protein